MRLTGRTFLAVATLGTFLGAASLSTVQAQPSTGSNYHTQTMNYDLWCQQEAGLPPDRCDKRLPEDEKVFEAYRAKVEQYEIPYLQRKNDEARINRVILHNDPIDNPLNNDPSRQRQDPYQPPLHSPP